MSIYGGGGGVEVTNPTGAPIAPNVAGLCDVSHDSRGHHQNYDAPDSHRSCLKSMSLGCATPCRQFMVVPSSDPSQ